MKTLRWYFRAHLAAILMLAAIPAEAADVKPLFATDLADIPGKEARMLEVSYAPGAQDMVHRHDAHVFVYVLEGEIRSKVGDDPEKTYKVGEMFLETPGQLHAVSGNASATRPAKLLAILLAEKESQLTTPAQE